MYQLNNNNNLYINNRFTNATIHFPSFHFSWDFVINTSLQSKIEMVCLLVLV